MTQRNIKLKLAIAILLVLNLLACDGNNTEIQTTDNTNNLGIIWTTDVNSSVKSTSNDSEICTTARSISAWTPTTAYSEAVSAEEVKQLKEEVLDFVQNKLCYEVAAEIRVVNDKSPWYSEYHHYGVGNVIILETEVNYGDSNVRFAFFYVKQEETSEWIMVNYGK